MKLLFLLLYMLVPACCAFTNAVLSNAPHSRERPRNRRLIATHRSFLAFSVSFVLWFLCAQFFTPLTVNPFFFLLAHLAIYASLFLTAYHALGMRNRLPFPAKFALVLVPMLAAGLVSLLLSNNASFTTERTTLFFDRYDDIASISVFCALLGMVFLILGKRGPVGMSTMKAPAVLFGLALMCILDLSFLWTSQSLFFIPLSIIIINLLIARVTAVAQPINAMDQELSRAGVTTRERAVIKRLLEGASYAEIAEREFISVHTVKSHARNAYRKLGVGTRHQLTALLTR